MLFGDFVEELDFVYWWIELHRGRICAQPGKQACFVISWQLLAWRHAPCSWYLDCAQTLCAFVCAPVAIVCAPVAFVCAPVAFVHFTAPFHYRVQTARHGQSRLYWPLAECKQWMWVGGTTGCWRVGVCCTLQGLSLQGCTLQWCTLKGRTLQGCTLEDFTLRGVLYRGVIYKGLPWSVAL